MEPSLIFAMGRAEVERLIAEKPQVGIRMISLLSERLHYHESRMEDVTLKKITARLASLILFLIESEGVQVPGEIRVPTRYTHEHLGTMIWANREGRRCRLTGPVILGNTLSFPSRGTFELRMCFLRSQTGGVELGIVAMTEIRHSTSFQITNSVVQVQSKASARLNASNTADRSDAEGYWTAGS